MPLPFTCFYKLCSSVWNCRTRQSHMTQSLCNLCYLHMRIFAWKRIFDPLWQWLDVGPRPIMTLFIYLTARSGSKELFLVDKAVWPVTLPEKLTIGPWLSSFCVRHIIVLSHCVEGIQTWWMPESTHCTDTLLFPPTTIHPLQVLSKQMWCQTESEWQRAQALKGTAL